MHLTLLLVVFRDSLLSKHRFDASKMFQFVYFSVLVSLCQKFNFYEGGGGVNINFVAG